MIKDEVGESAATPRAGAQAWWLVAVLTLLYMLSYLDRQIITLMVDPIRSSLGVSEVQIGLLQGFAFAFFYVIAALPLGIAADRLPRRKVIFIGVVVWSLAASACGLANKFWQLLLARFGVGAGEAALLPAGYSLIASTFPKEKLGLAISIFVSGSSIGGAAAVGLGAWIIANVPAGGVVVPVLGSLEPWQAAFILSGLPCLVAAPLIFTVRERRTISPPETGIGMSAAIAEVWRRKQFYLCHFFGFGIMSLCGFAVTTWLPTFLMRSHGMSVLETGSTLAGMLIVCSLAGTIAIGAVGDWLYRRGWTNGHIVTAMGVLVLQSIAISTAMAMDDRNVVLAILVPYFVLVGFHGASGASLQIATPEHLRGRVSAIYLFLYTLIGAGAGPVVPAMFSEWIVRDPQKMGLSITLTVLTFAPVSLLLLWQAARALKAEQTASGADQTRSAMVS